MKLWTGEPNYHRLELEGFTDGKIAIINAWCTNPFCMFKIKNLEEQSSVDWEKLSRGCRQNGDRVFIGPDVSVLGNFSVVRSIPWMRPQTK